MNRLSNIKINKKRKKIRLDRLLILLTLLLAIIIVSYKTISLLFIKKEKNTEQTIYTNLDEIKYSIEKHGYSTIFTTNGKYNKSYKEFKQDQNAPWANEPYWGGTMSLNGCGITSMAIIASGYGLDITPETLRAQYYPHLEAEKMYVALNDLGITCSDFWFTSIYLNEEYILEWLESERPILICVDNKKENKWTEASHYMVLLKSNKNGMVYISNPNGKDNTKTASGWYYLNEILPYTAKALFIENYI